MAPAAHREKKVTGEAYGRLSADFSADQQDTSAIVQIAGSPVGDGRMALGSLWVGPTVPLVPVEVRDELI